MSNIKIKITLQIFANFLPYISMIIIGHFLILLIMVEIDGLEQAINVKELTGFVGVKVPTKRVEISSWITDDKGLIVEAQPNNEIHIYAAEPQPNMSKFDFHFLSKTAARLDFLVEIYGHDLKQDSINACHMDLKASLGNSCKIVTFKEFLVNIFCSYSSTTPARQNHNGFKLEHTELDRWLIVGWDWQIGEYEKYITYSILHATFGPTQKDFCKYKVILNSQIQIVEDGSASRKDNRDNILLLPKEKVPEEMREDVFYDPDNTTPSTPSTITSTTSSTTTSPPSTSTVPEKNKVRWTFPPTGNEKVFAFMNN